VEGSASVAGGMLKLEGSGVSQLKVEGEQQSSAAS